VRPGSSEAPGDGYGHGTFVAGIAGGANGIAPGATIYGVNVARADGVYTSDVLSGLDWVLANHKRLGIRVVSLSLSETVPSSYLANPLDAAVEKLWREGLVVVVSAGNLGADSVVFAPANDPHVITVGATDTSGTVNTIDDRVASFSSYGTTLDGFRKPEVLAPGRRIASLLPTGTALAAAAPAGNLVAPGYATMSGTSFSAPQVAGAAALLLDRDPTLTPDQVKWLLTRSVRAVAGSESGTLSLDRALAFQGTPASANEGVAPTAFATAGAPTSAFAELCTAVPSATGGPDYSGNSWNGNTWNGNSWNGNSWNANSWNSFSWD
jgi:serine protease AprX